MNLYIMVGFWSGAFFQAASVVLATVYYGPAAGMLTGLSLSAAALYVQLKISESEGGDE